MKITTDFSRVIKILFICFAMMFCYSLALSVFGMHGLSISNPSDNTTLRVVLNKLQGVLYATFFWVAIGYLTKDYKAALIALGISLALLLYSYFGQPETQKFTQTKDYKFYLNTFLYALPYLAFGLLYFKNAKGIFFAFAAWLLLRSINTFPDISAFESIIESFTRMVGIRNPFEFRIPTGENSYRPINILRIVIQNLSMIIHVILFWWLYCVFTKGKLSIRSLNTVPNNPTVDKVSYSIIYWSMRIYLFVIGFGIATYIARFTRDGFKPYILSSIIFFTISLIIFTSIYRNFLVSRYVAKGSSPGSLFVLLNIPIVNILAWLFSLSYFEYKQVSLIQEEENPNIPKDKVKEVFAQKSKNGFWKFIFIAATIFSIVSQFNKHSSQADELTLIISSVCIFCLLIWYLFDHRSYIPIIVILALNIIIVTALSLTSLIHPTIATSIINIVLYFGLFHYNHLKYEKTMDDLVEEVEE